ncbi:MAG TPA: hypothetical protein VFV34_22550 [Blastocatellia bacterium]|nr:hypothetical protein [Blastocatellia bacterium]
MNLVSQALTETREDFFTKIDSGFDQFIARYSEHIFKDAPTAAADRRVLNSWKLLGEGVVTSLVDMILFCLMMNILPFRFFMLIISTPVRLLTQRGKRQRKRLEASPEPPELGSQLEPQKWLSAVPSVSENTTDKLEEKSEARRLEAAKE